MVIPEQYCNCSNWDYGHLRKKRNRSDLLEVLGMYKGLSLIPFNKFFVISPVVNTRGHTAKIMKSRCQLDLRRFFFSQRVVDRWNGLQQSRLLLIVPLWTLLRTVSTECGRWRWAISWTNQFAWPSGLISSDVFGSGGAAPGKLPGKYIRPSNAAHSESTTHTVHTTLHRRSQSAPVLRFAYLLSYLITLGYFIFYVVYILWIVVDNFFKLLNSISKCVRTT